jgi:hypothetical protein
LASCGYGAVSGFFLDPGTRSARRRKLAPPPLAAVFLDLGRRFRLVLLEPADQVGNVGDLLFEIALVLLEAFENALGLVPASADAAASESSVSVMHVHPLSSM